MAPGQDLFPVHSIVSPGYRSLASNIFGFLVYIFSGRGGRSAFGFADAYQGNGRFAVGNIENFSDLLFVKKGKPETAQIQSALTHRVSDHYQPQELL